MKKEIKVAMIMAALLLSLVTISSVSAADYGTNLKATYHGGNSTDNMTTYGNKMAVANDGSVYVVGTTTSSNLPTTPGAYQRNISSANRDVFIAKYNKDTSRLIAGTYLGGLGHDYGHGIALSSNGDVYVTGQTNSLSGLTSQGGFPVTPGAYDTTRAGSEVFVAAFDSSLSNLLACTFLGGSSDDMGYDITIDNNDTIYVTGTTRSGNFAAVTEYGYQQNKSVLYDAFVGKLDPSLSTLYACTYFGGNDVDSGYSIAVASDGNIYITGRTASSDLAANGYKTTRSGSADAFIAKFNSTLDGLLACTYFGGSDSNDDAYDITIGSDSSIYITGATNSDNLFNNYASAYDKIRNGTDAYLAKFNSTLTSLLAGTYFGGSDTEAGYNIAIGNNGKIYITGVTSSNDLPILEGNYTTISGGQDAFLASFNSSLSALNYTTYYGGSADDTGLGLAFTTEDAIVMAGNTASTNIPTAYNSLNGGTDVFLSLWFFGTAFQTPIANFTANVTQGVAPLTVQFLDTSSNYPTSWAWDFNNDGTIDSTLQHPTHTYNTIGNYTVKLTVTNTAGSNTKIENNYITVSPTVAPVAAFNATVTAAGITTIVTKYQTNSTVQFTDKSTGYPTSWAWDFNNDGTIDSTLQNPTWTPANGNYTVKLTVSNSNSTNSITKSNYITVDNLKIYSTAQNNTTPNAPDPGIAGIINGTLNPIFKEWAREVVDYSPANQTIDGGWTDPNKALGPVTGNHFDIVSLGDLTLAQLQKGEKPGSITLGFNVTIVNGAGADFVVFENGFLSTGGAGVAGQIFAELGYVEVSSDNETFVRFPSISLTPGLVGGYGTVDPTGVYNLVGKHVNGYDDSWGTPFDLQNLINTPEVLNGLVDLNDIKYVRIIDIPGCGFFRDSEGRPIYDAWITWGSGGLDLEAVGVINYVEPVENFTATPTTGTAPLELNISTSAGITSNDGDFKNNETKDNKLQKTTQTYNTELEANKLAGSEEVKTNHTTVSKTPKLTNNKPTTHNTQIKTNKNLTKQKKANTAAFTEKPSDDSNTQLGKISVPALATGTNTNVTFNRMFTTTETRKLPLIANKNQANNQKNQKIK